jgi:ferredoxin
MEAHRNGTPVLASSGYVAQVDVELCAACDECADYCQFAAISVDDGFACTDAAACMGCGVCVAHCPQEAILLSQSILQADEFIKDQDGMIGAHSLDGLPVMPARVKVLVFGQVVFFEVVGQRLR